MPVKANDHITKSPSQPQPPANFKKPSYAVNLALNENPFPPSPKAMDAYKNAGEKLNRYPEYTSHSLRQVLGDKYGIDNTRIMCTAGSEQMLAFLARAYIDVGDEVIYPKYGFMIYKFNIAMAGAVGVPVEHDDFRINVQYILDAVTDKTRLVFLDNPGNPTGTYVPYDEIKRLREELRDDILLVLDAAYAEFCTEDDYDAGLALVDEYDNVVVTRTLSKLYGLSGLRVGWTYGPAEIINTLLHLKGGFNVAIAAQAAGTAAVMDDEYASMVRDHSQNSIDWMSEELRMLGIKVTPSVCNFMLIHFPGGRDQMKACDEYLKENDIGVGPLGAYGLDASLRITVGTDEENKIFVDAMKTFMGK